ncbi:ABC transporter ATP-binding protein [Clostridium sp. C8-1-8]|uniref:ABC transporter ATP-binding protein n=1 Tax=Clostridium sp. C8-1-8 TaxID=2698831 RepID=UPI001368C6D2|nr:ABC transporter ATP-binding protein [Clostridium sp. C8-1-8]
MKDTLITLSNVKKNYGSQRVLKNINLSISSGKIYVIMGPSGTGKSTLLNIISMIEPQSDGEYLWKGKSVNDINVGEKALIRRTKLGIIFQEFNLFEELTAYENLDIYLKLTTKFDDKERNNMILTQVDKLGISPILNKRVKFLSGGERQRVTIARCYLNETELILADEPSANIDSDNKEILISSFLQLRESGKAILIVTHDDSYKSIADVVYNIKSGEIY